jgi:hypothetical protein
VFAGGITSSAFTFGGSSSALVISNCVNAGKVEIKEDDESSYYGCAIVGFAGEGAWNIKYCYSVNGEVLASTEGFDACDISDSSNAYLDETKRTVAENYAGLDFESTWSLGEQKGYPELL